MFEKIMEMFVRDDSTSKEMEEVETTEYVEETEESQKKKIVLDASVISSTEIIDLVSNILSKDDQIIVLTSVTLVQLDHIKRGKTEAAYYADYILSTAAEKPEHFEIAMVSHKGDYISNIIDYCSKNVEEVELVTSNKKMLQIAIENGISYKYLNLNGYMIVSIYPAEMVNNHLQIQLLNTEFKTIWVIKKNGKIYKEGIIELNVGDNILMSSDKFDTISFAHYKVILDNQLQDNCELIYGKKFSSKVKLQKFIKYGLKINQYRDFVKDVLEPKKAILI